MFDYHSVLERITALVHRGASAGSIGRTVLGRLIPYVFVGNAKAPKLLVQGGIHAREYVTGELVLRQAAKMLEKPPKDFGIYFFPMINVDGVMLALYGLDSVFDAEVRRELSKVGGSDFSLWKANAACVDLNVNFDARWGTGRSNVRVPAPSDYIGKAPFDQPESRALAEFTKIIRPIFTVSYHTKGEEIYWEFFQDEKRRARDLALATVVAQSTGYPLRETSDSAGGYKDWCIETLKIPSVTVEVGNASFRHPLGKRALPNILQKNLSTVSDVLAYLRTVQKD